MSHALTVRLDDELAERLRAAAFQHRCHASDIIRTALTDFLGPSDEQPIGHVPTKAGLNYLAIRKQQTPKVQERP